MQFTNKPLINIITLCFLYMFFKPNYGLKSCEFSAIFNFGDSVSDTGELAAAFTPPNPPYGQAFSHMPAGRYSDGRFTIDFMAKSLKMPYLSAYLDSIGTNFKHGANFASGSATITVPTTIVPNPGGFSPFNLDVQYYQFMQFISRSKMIKKKEFVHDKDYFEKALYTLDIGHNDLSSAFFGNLSLEEVNASIPNIVNRFSVNVKNIYDLGARSFWIHNTAPAGCITYILENFPSAEKDEAGCAKAYNEIAQYFNFKLKEAVTQLRKDLPLAAFTYVDIYSVTYSLFEEPKKYGFELPLVACCGYGGGKYNYSKIARCGDRITVKNGTQIVVDSSCDRPFARISWDGSHFTEAANKFIVNRIATGAFSDPPVPLNMACHRNITFHHP